MVLLDYGSWSSWEHSAIESWLNAQGSSLPVLLGADPEWLGKKYKIRGTPNTFILDEKGAVLFRYKGFGTGVEKVLEAGIREVLGMAPFPE